MGIHFYNHYHFFTAIFHGLGTYFTHEKDEFNLAHDYQIQMALNVCEDIVNRECKIVSPDDETFYSEGFIVVQVDLKDDKHIFNI